jgi:hypothetical protein
MSDKIKIQPHHLDHPQPVTRRDFLSQGLIGFSAMAMAPTALSLLFRSQQANASEYSDYAAESMIPFLVFDLAGGAGLPGNFLVGNKGGSKDLLPSYSTLGWDPKAAGALDESFGIPMSANFSKILQGMKTTASAQALAALRMGSFCNFTRDDTTDNPLSIITSISKMGNSGIFISNPVGSMNSASGGNSEPVLKELKYKPLQVATVNDITESVSFGPAFMGLSGIAKKAGATGIFDLSMGEAKKLAALDPADLTPGLAESAYKKNIEYADSSAGLDPRIDPVFSAVYNINANTSPTSQNAIFAAIAMNAIKGNTGPGVMTFGNCDYHTGNSQAGDAKDLEIGLAIGQAIEGAFRLGKTLAFQIVTDGGVYARDNSRDWQGDSGDRSLGIFGVMNPSGPLKMLRTQVGNYSTGQGVDRETLIGNRPNFGAYAMLANYLQICGKLKQVDDYIPRGIFSSDQLESVLLWDV